MTKYLRCIFLIFLYFFVCEGFSWFLFSLINAGEGFQFGSIVSHQIGVAGLALSQALMAYLFVFVLSRSDSTSTFDFVVLGVGVGVLLLIYKAVRIFVLQAEDDLLRYLWVVPLVIIQFGGGAWIFSKHQK